MSAKLIGERRFLYRIVRRELNTILHGLAHIELLGDSPAGDPDGWAVEGFQWPVTPGEPQNTFFMTMTELLEAIDRLGLFHVACEIAAAVNAPLPKPRHMREDVYEQTRRPPLSLVQSSPWHDDMT